LLAAPYRLSPLTVSLVEGKKTGFIPRNLLPVTFGVAGSQVAE
jgi:hypothetical protein